MQVARLRTVTRKEQRNVELEPEQLAASLIEQQGRRPGGLIRQIPIVKSGSLVRSVAIAYCGTRLRTYIVRSRRPW